MSRVEQTERARGAGREGRANGNTRAVSLRRLGGSDSEQWGEGVLGVG